MAADVVRLPDTASRQALIAEAVRREWPDLLPTRLIVGDDETAPRRLEAERRQRLENAAMEQAFALNRRAIDPALRMRPAFLRILISTYNRREFVVKNARWLVDKAFAINDPSVELMIIDGGSTDQTINALLGLQEPRLQLGECPTNVGMLAGFREAAVRPGAEYIWIIGDDDYLVPEQVQAVVAQLRANRGISFGFVNFSVYHRQTLGPSDTPARLIASAAPVGTNPTPSGVIKVRQAAEQTDNLFTAIYTIIWRADLLSAAYEHSFTGQPFIDLTEAIPCTDFILRRYGECDAYWHAPPAIAANAFNSWRRHRPRWHGAVMPMAFALARDAGVDRRLLQQWAGLHWTLLDEALEIAREDGFDPKLYASDEALAEAVFRRPLPSAVTP